MSTNNTDFRKPAVVIDGVDGTNGIDGDDGLSAYQIAVNNGFVGTEEEWLTSLQAEFQETFETVSQNLKSYPYDANFVNGVPETIDYDTGNGIITKTITFTSGKPTSIVFSGAVPEGINITKTISYDIDKIIINYSGGN